MKSQDGNSWKFIYDSILTQALISAYVKCEIKICIYDYLNGQRHDISKERTLKEIVH